MTILFQTILFILLIFNVNQSYALPSCTGDYYHNCYGTRIHSSGQKYVGEFQDNKMHGRGTVTVPYSGYEYQGEFRNDERNGFGVATFRNGSAKYIGEYRNGLKNGQGIEIQADGHKFIGQWLNDDPYGEGIAIRPDGKKQEGLFNNDKFIKSQKVRNIESDILYRAENERKIFQRINENTKYAEREESKQNEENIKQAEKERKKQQAEEKKQQALKALESKKITLAMGSGFWFNDLGYFATNHHVIDGCEKVQLIEGNNLIDSEIVTFDKINDLAIGKVNKKVKASFILSKNPELGEEVMVGGFPLSNVLQNDSIKITRGIVSSLSGLNNNYSMLQIDAPIQQGNSGGPIINSYGEVIGVATSYLRSTKEFDTQNVNFGVKVNLIRNMSESLGIKVAKANKQKAKNTKQLAKLLEKNTIHIHCTNTYKQWVVLQNNRKSNTSLSEHIKLNLKDYMK